MPATWGASCRARTWAPSFPPARKRTTYARGPKERRHFPHAEMRVDLQGPAEETAHRPRPHQSHRAHQSRLLRLGNAVESGREYRHRGCAYAHGHALGEIHGGG